MTPDEVRAAFEKRFDPAFQRLYAYILRRTKDHTAAERLTRQVLLRSLPELLDDDEAKLAPTLLRTAHHVLGAEKTEYALE